MELHNNEQQHEIVIGHAIFKHDFTNHLRNLLIT